jgi:hypothetical protein
VIGSQAQVEVDESAMHSADDVIKMDLKLKKFTNQLFRSCQKSMLLFFKNLRRFFRRNNIRFRLKFLLFKQAKMVDVQKNAIFSLKISKNRKNRDHNIDPRFVSITFEFEVSSSYTDYINALQIGSRFTKPYFVT